MSRVARLAALCVVLCVLAGVSSFTFKPRGRGVSRQNRLISKSATSFEIHYDDDSSEAESMSSSELGRRKQTSEQVGSRMGVCTLERYNMAEVSGTGVSGRLQICGGLASQWFDSTSAAPYFRIRFCISDIYQVCS